MVYKNSRKNIIGNSNFFFWRLGLLLSLHSRRPSTPNLNVGVHSYSPLFWVRPLSDGATNATLRLGVEGAGRCKVLQYLFLLLTPALHRHLYFRCLASTKQAWSNTQSISKSLGQLLPAMSLSGERDRHWS